MGRITKRVGIVGVALAVGSTLALSPTAVQVAPVWNELPG